jgi:hypothetical protein
MRIRTLWLALAVALMVGTFACREEGAAEKAGRKLDEAVDTVRHGNEGELEKLGRKTDDAIDDVEEKAEDLKDKATEED